MPLKLNTASSGSVTLTPADTASNYTITVPAQTATMAINGPAFSAYSTSVQTVSNNTLTKIAFQAEDFDTASCFDSSTNYRFTPNVAGYYQVNTEVLFNGTVSTSQALLMIYKNGGSYSRLFDINPSASLSANSALILGNSILIYLNGTTDYIELYGYYFGGTATFSGTTSNYTSRFSASMVRAA